jgi:hypothetical protein
MFLHESSLARTAVSFILHKTQGHARMAVSTIQLKGAVVATGSLSLDAQLM